MNRNCRTPSPSRRSLTSSRFHAGRDPECLPPDVERSGSRDTKVRLGLAVLSIVLVIVVVICWSRRSSLTDGLNRLDDRWGVVANLEFIVEADTSKIAVSFGAYIVCRLRNQIARNETDRTEIVMQILHPDGHRF